MLWRRKDRDSGLGSLESGTLHGSGDDSSPPPTWEQAGRPRRRRRRLAPFALAFVALDLLILAVVGGVLLLSGGDDEPAGERERSAQGGERPAGEGEPRGSAEPGLRASPVTASGMRAALRIVRREAGGREVVTLRVDREAVQAILRGRLVVVRRDRVTTLSGPSTPTGTFPLSRVDARAPARIDAALRRDGRRLSYAVVREDPISRRVEWLAFVDEGRTGYRTDAAGRGLCPLGRTC